MLAWMKKITLEDKQFIVKFFERKGDTKKQRLDKAKKLFVKSEKIEAQAIYIKSMCCEVLRRR